jgi:heptosyltransferase-2/heptosyltransferase-3
MMASGKRMEDSLGEDGVSGPIEAGAVERILVCQLRQIGDVLLSTPSIELLARRFPKAQIHVFTEKKCASMLENNPHVHTVWPLDKKRLPTLLHQFAFYRKVAAQKFDLLVDFQQLPRCCAMTALSGAPVRLSFPPPWYLRPLYTHWTQPKPTYAAAYKAGILKLLGIHWQGERPRIYLTEEERTLAGQLLDAVGISGRPFVSVDVTHKQNTRRWPARHYAALLDMMAKERSDLFFFLPYGPGEEEEVRAMRELCACKKRVVLPPEPLNLRELPACMERAILQLGNCSSPRHMAVALGVPTFTILGATGKGWTFPSPEHRMVRAKMFMDMPCQHCNKNTCSSGVPCLEKLEPGLVLPLVMEHLLEYGKERPIGQSN